MAFTILLRFRAMAARRYSSVAARMPDFARLVLLIRLDFTFGKGLISNMFTCTKQKYIFSIDCTTAFLSAIALMPVALL